MIKPDTLLKVTFECALSPEENKDVGDSFTESQRDIVEQLLLVSSKTVPRGESVAQDAKVNSKQNVTKSEKEKVNLKRNVTKSECSVTSEIKPYLVSVSGPPPAEVSTLGSIVSSISEQVNCKQGPKFSQFISSSDKTVPVTHVVVSNFL
jgi:hypothetical protein